MEHFPRFRRKKDIAPPTLITPNNVDTMRQTTPPPGDLHPVAQPVAPMRSVQKLSPFNLFHRSSGKRARDSPPASLPHSPAAAAVFSPDSIAERPVSPLSLKTDGNDHASRPPKIPAFLELSSQDIMAKFHELTWLERSRLSQAANNPSPDFRWARPQGQHTRKLDRYANIQPWDNHRVKLQVPDGHMDYINASPIILTPSSHPTSDGRTAETREPDRYIAMQGPKKQSLDHTWRMIVEQLESPAVIVMLTETHEGYVEKCFPYFPRTKDDAPLEINEQDEFGDGFRATVRCEGIEETPAGDAIELRKLVIRVHSRGGNGGQNDSPVSTPSPIDNHPNDEMRSPFTDKEDAGLPSALAEAEPRRAFDHGSFDSSPSPSSPRSSGDHNGLAGENEVEERVVWHFLYKKWPDFGVPKQGDLESFFTLMRLSREKNAGPHNPRIVHCSAGVGRSGTFIALEHLIRELDAGVLEHYDERLATPPPLSAHSPSGSGTGNDGSSGGRSGNSSPATTKEEEGEDLIFSVVNQLREQRGSMVQAEVQYLFIYMVMRKLWRDKYSKYGTDGDEGQGEPAAKRLEVDPFVA